MCVFLFLLNTRKGKKGNDERAITLTPEPSSICIHTATQELEKDCVRERNYLQAERKKLFATLESQIKKENRIETDEARLTHPSSHQKKK